MTEFTPGASLIGGAMIGLAAVVLMAGSGRIAGISGILGRLLPPYREGGDSGGALAFVIGLMAAPVLAKFATGSAPVQAVSANVPLMLAAGLLVGVGTALGSGCTSGHGVCGLARLSPRSLAAVMAFMATGFATVFVVRHMIGG